MKPTIKKVPRRIKKVLKFSIPLPPKEIKDISKKFKTLEAGDLLAYLMNRSNRLNTLIEEKVVITDQSLYEAINSARGSVEVPLERLKKLLWNVTIIPAEKREITRERMNEVRKAYGGI